MGEDQLTPQGRWVRFKPDFKQESGNGWKQHSVGTYSIENDSKLRIHNTNGYVDNYPAFDVEIDGNQMTWTREEEGEIVEVDLVRIESLPQREADKLLGVWDLESVTVDGENLIAEKDPESKRYFYLAWDGSFRIQHTPEGRLRGIYHTDGHRPILEMAYYDEREMQGWEYEVTEDKLQLTSLGTEETEIRIYTRIDHFP